MSVCCKMHIVRKGYPGGNPDECMYYVMAAVYYICN